MNWLKEVSQADTLDGLLMRVNDFILEQPDEHWSWIPKSSRPSLVATAQELHQWHHRIATDLARTASPNIRMQDLAVFFLRASARAHQLAIAAERRESSNQDEMSGRKAKSGRRH
jgi:hypothetical protein